MTIRIGSLFSGYGGLDMAVADALGLGHTHTPVWHSDIKPASIALLAHRHPDVPNLGDMTAIWPVDPDNPDRLLPSRPTPPIDVLAASWPCFTGDTIVVTERGTIPISEVAVGDLVLTHRNRWRRVLHTGSRVVPVREVRAQGAPPTRTTDDHPFYVRDFSRYYTGTRKLVEWWSDPEWCPASEIAGRRVAIPAVVESAAAHEWPWTPWLVGRWVADGWAELNTNRVKWAVGHDKVEKFRAELERAGLTATEYEQPGCTRFTVGTTDVGEWLVEHFGSGAGAKRIPGWLLACDERQEWLDGYLSGDGYKRSGASWAVTISRALAVGVAVLGATLGLAPQVKLANVAATTQIDGRTVNQQPWYRVGLRHLDTRQTVRWRDGMAWSRVKSTVPTGQLDQVWNLHVEEDNSYTADGLVVHNCQPHSAAGKRLGEKDPRALWPHVARAIAETRPAIFFGENVARIATNGELRRVVRSLADLGYMGAWRCVRASDVGACHRRDRCFVVAVDPAADTAGVGRVQGRPEHAREFGRLDAALSGTAPADLTLFKTPTAQLAVNGGTQHPDKRKAVDWKEGSEFVARPEKIKLTHTIKHLGDTGQQWGQYEAAIRRHEQAFGYGAPAPTVTSPRTGKPILSPAFVEFMMMVEPGWVTDAPGQTRNSMLSLLGDGVVPAQGAYAFRFLLDHLAQRLGAVAA